MKLEERVWLHLHEVGVHNEKCGCHPVRPRCCGRWPPDGVLDPASADAIDSAGFAWHVVRTCRPAATAARRVLAGGPSRYIGDPE